MEEKYLLNKSSIISIDENSNEARIDMSIEKYTSFCGIIKGQVRHACTLMPVKRAYVKVTDEHYNPICHCETDGCGVFTMRVDFPGGIIINIAKPGFITYASKVYKIENPELNCLKIKLIPSFGYRNIVYGKVNDECMHPLNEISVSLKGIDSRTVEYKACTGSDGFFIFDGIVPGRYVFSIQSSSYYCKRLMVFVCKKNWKYNLGMITAVRKILKGTLNGIISDIWGNPIDKALVVLFDGKSNVPIKMTYTNEKGAYLFGGLGIGEYYIISKK